MSNTLLYVKKEMESNQQSLNISVNDAIDKISTATGNNSFRLSSPLSGNVKNNTIRVALPPGFNYPCQPVLTAKLNTQNNGCNITYSFTPPYICALSLATLWIVLFNLFWPDTDKIIIGSVVLVILSILFLMLRNSDKNKLIQRVFSELNDENV